MRIEEAKSKSKRKRLFGWLLSTVFLAALSISAIKFLYQSLNESSFHIIQEFCNFIELIYQDSEFFRIVWGIAPDVHYPHFWVLGNLKLIAFIALFLVGVTMKKDGDYLESRIFEAEQEAEKERWKMAMNGATPAGPQMVFDIVIDSRDTWYKRPVGVIALGVLAGYTVLVLGRLSGF